MAKIYTLLIFCLPIVALAQQPIKYKYWYDNNIAGAITQTSNSGEINLSLNTELLTPGYHSLNFQSQDVNGFWSSIITQLFLRTEINANQISVFKYWFDNDTLNSISRLIIEDSSYNFNSLIDIETISIGTHQINYQFRDRNSKWSPIFTDTISREVITLKEYIKPKLYLSKSTVNYNESITITGKDFSTNGLISLYITDASGTQIPTDNIIYKSNGEFSFTLPITTNFKKGECIVYAHDVNNNQTTPSIRFKITAPDQTNLIITSPSVNNEFNTGAEISISWSALVKTGKVQNKTGFATKKFKLEYSKDGSGWNFLEESKVFTNAKEDEINEFVYIKSFASPGTYQIRVTDIDIPNSTNTSNEFKIHPAETNTFSTELNWDNKKSAQISGLSNPYGLAADGTSRIIINLKRKPGNAKTVSAISAEIIDPTLGNTSGTSLLGKLSPVANYTTGYNDEAKRAIESFCDTSYLYPNFSYNYYFWMVAPEDFTHDPISISSERKLKVKFIVTYADGTTSTVFQNNIQIVRPPIIFVHGINSSGKDAWEKSNFKIGNSSYNFMEVINSRAIWKYGLLPDLIPYGSYSLNASILLSNADISFPSSLDSMIKKGFASCKIDYVCHSMGGAIARTAIGTTSKYYTNKNYNKGYINRLITVNTPHNGSYIANYLVDNFESISKSYLTRKAKYYYKVNGFFNPLENKPSDAVYNLQSLGKGQKLPDIIGVKNHLIGSDIDENNTTPMSQINLDNHTAELIILLNSTEVPLIYKDDLPKYISRKYSNNEYYSNTDVVVPISSQLPSTSSYEIDIIDKDFINGHKSRSIIYNNYLIGAPGGYTDNATDVTHTSITNNSTIGSRIMFLLNSAINSTSFSDKILENSPSNKSIEYSPKLNISSFDSVFSYFDTTHIKITSPVFGSILVIDSALKVNIFITDTTGLKYVQLLFQGNIYESTSTVKNQSFNVSLLPNSIGENKITVRGIYDSLGFTIYRSDTSLVLSGPNTTLEGFYINPKSQKLNKHHIFFPNFNLVYPNYIGNLNKNDSISFIIADTNVVKYIDSIGAFTTLDTGSTHIIFHYKGFTDSSFIYVGNQENSNKTIACANNTIILSAGTNDNTKTYQWQIDSSMVFEDLQESSIYSGTSTPTLTLNNVQSSLSNYRYRCIISDAVGYTPSSIFSLQFSNSWLGTTDSTWQNPNNWSCGAVPDSNTDVIIRPNTLYSPTVSTNVICKSLTLANGALIYVKPNGNIDIVGKKDD